jgi:hypothetical protein
MDILGAKTCSFSEILLNKINPFPNICLLLIEYNVYVCVYRNSYRVLAIETCGVNQETYFDFFLFNSISASF